MFDNYDAQKLFNVSAPSSTWDVLYSEKQSRSNSRWMRLILPNNNRRELVLLSRLAQTMAIHANPRAKRNRQSTSHAKVPVRHLPIFLSLYYTFTHLYLFDSSTSAVGVQWCQTIDPYFRRRVEAWTRIRAVEHQGDVSLIRCSPNLLIQTNDYLERFLKNSRNEFSLFFIMPIITLNKIIF